jgi:hypothetical protein
MKKSEYIQYLSARPLAICPMIYSKWLRGWSSVEILAITDEAAIVREANYSSHEYVYHKLKLHYRPIPDDYFFNLNGSRYYIADFMRTK